MPLPLLALFFAAFAFGTTEFVIAGVLPQVAEGKGGDEQGKQGKRHA